MKINRQLLGDFALAVALVLPTAAIAGSAISDRQPAATSPSPVVAKAAPAERTMAERGVGLLG